MLKFTVVGTPRPQGSKRSFGGRPPIETNAATLRPWRAAVAAAALQARQDANLDSILSGPVSVFVEFTFTRPKSHYGTGRNEGKVKASAPQWVPVKPDLDKLIRAVNDSLTEAGVFRDDAQIAQLTTTKQYGDTAAATIWVDTVREDNP